MSDRDLQERLWLGKIPGKQSSFVEAVNGLFSHSLPAEELDQGRVEYPLEVVDKLRELRAYLTLIADDLSEEEIIGHWAMVKVRELSAATLTLLRQWINPG